MLQQKELRRSIDTEEDGCRTEERETEKAVDVNCPGPQPKQKLNWPTLLHAPFHAVSTVIACQWLLSLKMSS